MNKIVIYTSKTGFTKTYAQRIATELGCGAKSLKEVKNEDELRMLETAKGMDRTDKEMIKHLLKEVVNDK